MMRPGVGDLVVCRGRDMWVCMTLSDKFIKVAHGTVLLCIGHIDIPEGHACLLFKPDGDVIIWTMHSYSSLSSIMSIHDAIDCLEGSVDDRIRFHEADASSQGCG